MSVHRAFGEGAYRAAKLEPNTYAIEFDAFPDSVVVAHWQTPILFLRPDRAVQVLEYHKSFSTHQRYDAYAPWRVFSYKGKGYFYADRCFSIPAHSGVLLGWDFGDVQEEALYTRLGSPSARKKFVKWMREQPWMNEDTIEAVEHAPKRGWGYGVIKLREPEKQGVWLTDFKTGELLRPVTIGDTRCLRIPNEPDREVWVGQNHYLTVLGAEYGAHRDPARRRTRRTHQARFSVVRPG